MVNLLKNKNIIISLVIVGLIAISSAISVFIPKVVNIKDKKENSNNIIYVSEDFLIDSEDDISLEDENNIIGTINIPKIGITAPIKEGIDQDTLANYVGHFTNSSIWEGNVALASHNRGSEVKHYFEKIHELVNGDTIIYKTKLGEKTYQVTTVKEIEDTDWSVTKSNINEKNTITLITCITNHPELRLCVIAEEII